MIFIRASILITEHNIIMTNQNTKEWERWNSIPIFLIEATTLCLVFLLIIAITTNFNKLLLLFFIFCEYFTWLFNCSLWVRYPSLGTHYYFWQHGAFAVKSHQWHLTRWLMTYYGKCSAFSEVIIVPKNGYRFHKEHWFIEYNNC